MICAHMCICRTVYCVNESERESKITNAKSNRYHVKHTGECQRSRSFFWCWEMQWSVENTSLVVALTVMYNKTLIYHTILKKYEHVLMNMAAFQAVCLEPQESSPLLAPRCQVPSLSSTTQPSEPSTLLEQAGLSLEAWVPWACQLLWLPTLS